MKVEVVDEPMELRKDPTVFRYQEKVYIMGGTFNNKYDSDVTPIRHNVVYFKSDTKIGRVEKVTQNEFPQDRYSYFIFPEGTFTGWSEWSDCSVSCGGGVSSRHRRCVNMFVELIDNAAFSCGLNPIEKEKCNKHRCPVWSKWMAWTSCSSSCGDTGIRTRQVNFLTVMNSNF